MNIDIYMTGGNGWYVTTIESLINSHQGAEVAFTVWCASTGNNPANYFWQPSRA